MSDTARTCRKSIWLTPIRLRDLLRGRFKTLVTWRELIAASGLPAPAQQAIGRIVKRTRLWRSEKRSVARELIAHFQDGLDTGASIEHLINTFGDQRLAARLIRRAKRRNRPMLWHIWVIALRGFLILLGIYAVLMLRFLMGSPTISVDYLARLNARTIGTPVNDRAWPLWRQFILAAGEPSETGRRVFPKAVVDPGSISSWPEAVAWIDAHQPAMQLAREAGHKSALGFILGAQGSTVDPELHLTSDSAKNGMKDGVLISVLLPHLGYLRQSALLLSADARRAAELHDGARAVDDLDALNGLADQLQHADGLLLTYLVSVGVRNLMIECLQQILVDQPQSLDTGQLIHIAHEIAPPRVAADLLQLDGERFIFQDMVQRMYTDDGHGNGRLTFAGTKNLSSLAPMTAAADPTEQAIMIGASYTLLGADRADLLARFNQYVDQEDANLHKPIWQVDFAAVTAQLIDLKSSQLLSQRYLMLTLLMPVLNRAQMSCEQYLGQRDGALVGIALEIFHRDKGHYPAALDELTPAYLPQVPPDRVTGEPVKYRLIAGKPVVYSIGSDRIDDHGEPVKLVQPNTRQVDWDIEPSKAAKGDWILYPVHRRD